MVLKSFLFELSFIALTGIAMGVALGVALSYDLYLRFFANQAAFVIPWDRLLLLGGIAFLGAVLATARPAIRASRMPPAEARRRFAVRGWPPWIPGEQRVNGWRSGDARR